MSFMFANQAAHHVHSVFLSFCLLVIPSISLSVFLSFCLTYSLFASFRLSVFYLVILVHISSPVYLSLLLSFCLSVLLFICLYILVHLSSSEVVLILLLSHFAPLWAMESKKWMGWDGWSSFLVNDLFRAPSGLIIFFANTQIMDQSNATILQTDK